MINITFPDGSVKSFEKGVTGYQIAESISPRLASEVLAMTVKTADDDTAGKGALYDLDRPINEDCAVTFHKWGDDEAKHVFWHSTSHLMAQALEALYPGVKFGIGPAIENGFYYDVDLQGRQITEADLKAIEDKMMEFARTKEAFVRKEVSKDDALKEYTSKMSGNADATMSALDGQNPLPASYAIEMDDPSKVASTAEKLKKNADFKKIVDDGDVNASVLYGQEEVSRLFQVTNYIRLAAVVLVALLTFIAFIFINNTIRLSITARRREIAIMRLVGASNGFIRGPFITEGVLQALIGSVLSIGVLELMRNLLVPRLQASIGWMSFSLPIQYYLAIYVVLILIGVLIGLFGSAIAMRRYLRV